MNPARYFLHVVPVLFGVVGALIVLVGLAAGSLLDLFDDATLIRGLALAGMLWLGAMAWGVFMNDLSG